MTLNTNYERVDALTHVSDQLYPILEEPVNGETRARRTMRLRIGTMAIAMRDGATPEEAGTLFDRHLAYVLRNVDYDVYDTYRTPAEKLPDITVPEDLANLINQYSDTLRRTYLSDSSTRESDAIHALHLTALAVPYARAHYPDLLMGRVGAYGPVHDFPEGITGDVPTFKISENGRRLKDLATENAIRYLWSHYGTEWPELIELIEAYESMSDREAAFVKTDDKNQPGYTHLRNDAYALRVVHDVQSVEEFYVQAEANTFQTLLYASQFTLALEDKDVLNERIAAFLVAQNE